ncbi:MAG: Fe-S cluster assembly protein HesB [Nocardioidaceae bacterium]
MLTLTENASSVVKSITDQATSDESAGLRISHEGMDESALNVAPAETPQSTDQIVEEGGARVFLAEEVVPALDDKVLDAMVDPDGGVQFSIATQPAG